VIKLEIKKVKRIIIYNRVKEYISKKNYSSKLVQKFGQVGHMHGDLEAK
jgi:hypothetical protein